MKIKNRPEFFGNQLILDENDEIVGIEENLLSNATDISIQDVKATVESFGGVCYPAHIDRDSNGIIGILGTIPEDTDFRYYEIHDTDKIRDYSSKYGIDPSRMIISSDAHYLANISDRINFFELDCDTESQELVREKLFKLLRS